jgi:hypothetical protein
MKTYSLISLVFFVFLNGTVLAGEPYPATPLEFKATVDLGGSYGKSIFSVKGSPVPSHTWWNIESMELVTQLGKVKIPKRIFSDFYGYSWPVVNKGIWVEIQFQAYRKNGGWPTIVSLPLKENKISSIRYKSKEGEFVEEKL